MSELSPDVRLDRIMRGRDATRNDHTSEFLATCAARMETNRRRLGISTHSIAIIQYLASHPSAIIVLEPNVRQAFTDAKKAFA